MKLWLTSIAMPLFAGAALAGEPQLLQDVGKSFESLPRVVIVATPGVDRAATLFWEQELEEAGLDVWLLPALPERDTESLVIEAIRQIDELWSTESYDILAHGYAGRLVVEANPGARKMALVGAPLGPQLTPTVSDISSTGLVSEGLPWPAELLGDLPAAPLPVGLAQAYMDFAERGPAVDPDAEVFLVASGGDVVAPVETVRLPSKRWSDRHFWRADALPVPLLDHGDLLQSKAVVEELKRYFAP